MSDHFVASLLDMSGNIFCSLMINIKMHCCIIFFRYHAVINISAEVPRALTKLVFEDFEHQFMDKNKVTRL